MTDKSNLWEDPHPMAVIAGDDHSPIPVLLVSPHLALATGTPDQVREWHATLAAASGCRVLAAPAEISAGQTYIAPVAAVDTHHLEERAVLTVELDAAAYDTAHLREDADQLAGRMHAALSLAAPAQPPAGWYVAMRDTQQVSETDQPFPFCPTDQTAQCGDNKSLADWIFPRKPKRVSAE